jgi:21S rRNA (GM2251-2'-O)-methyltransferase
MMAMTIKYTTAASQFLYGRSVVKAALEQNRRKLYNLYIYGGENRRDNKDNTIMTRMAEKHGVPITIVPTEEQRIMDKMSMGRPHNGFVLEASPLPQLPIKSLGKLEESPGRLGFHVDLDFQTKEEAAVNGTDSFTRRSNDVTPKPFVLLLNEIIDPGNLGGIIRTASYLGVDAVCITNRGSSTLTPVVLKSAVGAVEEISLFTVDDPVRFIEDSGRAGWKTYAAVAPPDRKLVRRHGDKFISLDSIEASSPLNEHPCLLVLGNEGHGLSKPVKVAADYELSVPRFVQGSCVDSLNVSVAAGLLCHAFVKEPVVEVKSEPIEQKTDTVESIEVESITAAVETEAQPTEQAQTESVSISEQAEETTEETEVAAKEGEKPSEEKEKKVEETNEMMF